MSRRAPSSHFDYQFLALVAVAFAVLTRGSLLPAAAMTAVVALVLFAYEAALRRTRRRIDLAPGPSEDPPIATDGDLTPWLAVLDRLLRPND